MTNKHGSPADRGSADRYYGRYAKPHYYIYGEGSVLRVEEKDMTPEQIDAYRTAYDKEEDRKYYYD